MDVVTEKFLGTLVKVVTSLHNFMKNELAQILETIGDIHLETAIRLLKEDFPNSSKPREVISDVVPVLEISYTFHYRSAKRWGNFIYSHVPYSTDHCVKLYEKAFLIKLFIALCNLYREDQERANINILQSRDAFYAYFWYFLNLRDDGHPNRELALESLNKQEEEFIKFCETLGIPRWIPSKIRCERRFVKAYDQISDPLSIYITTLPPQFSDEWFNHKFLKKFLNLGLYGI